MNSAHLKVTFGGYFSDHPVIPHLHFVFVARPRFHPGAPYDKDSKYATLFYVPYRLWHRRAYRVASALHQKHPFDLVHQVNVTGFREPGYMWRLGIPFIWGPIGGTQNYPWPFLSQAGWKGALHESCRTILNKLQLRYHPRVRKAAQAAAAILAASSTVRRDFARAHGIEPLLLVETGVASVLSQLPAGREWTPPLRIPLEWPTRRQ